MQRIPDLSSRSAPRYHFRQAGPGDLTWLINLRLATMAGYLEASGQVLSEQDQRERVLQDFAAIRIIRADARDVGMLKLLKGVDAWQVVQLQLLAELQGAGIGTAVLQDALTEARLANVPVSLSVLKVNPAKRLYDRLGFKLIREKTGSWEMQAC